MTLNAAATTYSVDKHAETDLPSLGMRIFLVEDNTDLREELVFSLVALGFNVTGFPDGSSLFRALAIERCDIVVIDVGLPGESGFSLAGHLRQNSNLGIVFLTALGTLHDRLYGMSLGADAYLVKPIDIHELAATLKAVARRVRTKADVPDNIERRSQSVSGWTLLQGGWILRNPRGSELLLTASERVFLKIMIASCGQLVERETLISAYAENDKDYDPHRLDSLIHRLRKRCDQAELGYLPIRSIRGSGYIFCPSNLTGK